MWGWRKVARIQRQRRPIQRGALSGELAQQGAFADPRRSGDMENRELRLWLGKRIPE